MLLYRPVGLNELRLLYQTGMRAFPPRLPEQPIFYPVTNQGYAEKIARDWNTRSETHAGFVTRFSVEDAYAPRFPRRVVGSREHEELWVPAEELPELNARLEGLIEVIGAFFGAGFVGDVPALGPLAGKDARAQLAALAAKDASGGDLADEVAASPEAIFLNALYWEHPGFTAEGVGDDERARVLASLRRSWAASGRERLRLGVAVEG